MNYDIITVPIWVSELIIQVPRRRGGRRPGRDHAPRRWIRLRLAWGLGSAATAASHAGLPPHPQRRPARQGAAPLPPGHGLCGGVPGKKGEPPKTDACKLITTDSKIGKSFIFEKDEFSLAEINHTIIVEKVIIPETEEKDFSKIRELAKKQGKLIRYSKIDEVGEKKEFDFLA